MGNNLLTFEWDTEQEKIEIHVNQEGAKKLISYLESFVDATANGHLHLKTPSWGGNELTEDLQGENDALINHVEICFWMPDQVP